MPAPKASWALGIAALLACRDRPPVPELSADTGPERRYVAVQLAPTPNPARAAQLRDSLAAAGWSTVLRATGPDGSRSWRIHLQPTTHLGYPELIASALRRELSGRPITVVHDSGPAGPPVVTGFTRVRYGAGSAMGRTRWAHSPDGRALLVVEEPGGIVLANEADMRLVQLDSAGAVSPTADWREVVIGNRGGGANVTWVEGPTYPPDPDRRTVLPVPGTTVESAEGWIRRNGRIIGPGTALTATRDGLFILALVPAGADASQEMLAVYRVGRADTTAVDTATVAQSPG